MARRHPQDPGPNRRQRPQVTPGALPVPPCAVEVHSELFVATPANDSCVRAPCAAPNGPWGTRSSEHRHVRLRGLEGHPGRGNGVLDCSLIPRKETPKSPLLKSPPVKRVVGAARSLLRPFVLEHLTKDILDGAHRRNKVARQPRDGNRPRERRALVIPENLRMNIAAWRVVIPQFQPPHCEASTFIATVVEFCSRGGHAGERQLPSRSTPARPQRDDIPRATDDGIHALPAPTMTCLMCTFVRPRPKRQKLETRLCFAGAPNRLQLTVEPFKRPNRTWIEKPASDALKSPSPTLT